MSARESPGQRGGTLFEVITALAVFSTALLVLAQLFAVATRSNRMAREVTYAAVLAAQKMEQLRGPVFSGLSPSPSSALTENTPGFVDYLDESGRWAGTGTTPSPRAVYVRRWSVEPLPVDPAGTMVLQVLVISPGGTENTHGNLGGTEGGVARLVGVRTWKLR
jgi:type II secretory pathway pseudopilin PulG